MKIRKKQREYKKRLLTAVLCMALLAVNMMSMEVKSLASEQEFEQDSEQDFGQEFEQDSGQDFGQEFEQDSGQDLAQGARSTGGGVTLDNLLCPDDSNRYSYTDENAEPGKRYALLVVSGIYETLDGADMDELSSSLLYIDQKTTESARLSFDGFVPVRVENSTVIITAEDASPYIAGYISKDILKAGAYTLGADGGAVLNDTMTVQKNTAWREFKSTLPVSCYVEIYSDYMDTFYCPVTLNWRDSDAFNSTKAGRTFSITADAVPQDSGKAGHITQLIKPFVATVTVQDTLSVPESISATKAKVVYREGEPFSDADVSVKALYSDGTMRDVTGWTSDISGLSGAEAGLYDLTVTYTEGGITLQAKIAIMITSASQPDTKVFQVAFETFGGSYVAPCFVEAGNRMEMVEEPVKSGFVFTGWYTDRYRTVPYDAQFPVDRDMTLYAGWRDMAEQTLTDLKVTLPAYSIMLGEILTEDQIRVRAVYNDGTSRQVEGFTHDLDTIDQSVTGIKTIHVRYTENGITKEGAVDFNIIASDVQTFRVSFDTGCGQTIKPLTVAAGEKLAEPDTVLIREGFLFSGWYLDGKCWDFETDIVDGDIVLKAKWLKKYGDTDFYCYTEEAQVYEYTGKAWKPAVVVRDKNLNMLRPNKDYTIKYTNNVQASTGSAAAKAVVTGKGNYAGTVTVPFTITAKNITDEAAVVMKLSQYNLYKKAGYKPVPSGRYQGKALKNNRDFTVSYQKLSAYDSEKGTVVKDTVLKEPGWYLVTVAGKGNFTGTRTFRFEIVPKGMKNLSKASLTLDKAAADTAYTGNAANLNGAVTLKFGKTILTEGVDYTLIYPADNVSVGKKQLTAKALPESSLCFGEKIIKYNITGLSMKQVSVRMKEQRTDYTGVPVRNELDSVTIRLDAKKAQMLNAYYGSSLADGDIYTLKENTDYTVSYKNHENAGSAVATLTGKGLFADSIKSKFTIDRINLNDSRIAVTLLNGSIKQNKSGAAAAVKVVYTGSRGIVLKEGTDYTLQYSNHKAAGTNAKVTIKGKGNYTGSVNKTYTIQAKPLNAKDIRIAVVQPVKLDKKGSYVYKPKVMVYDGSTALKEKTDYEVDYSGCVTQEKVLGGTANGYIIIRAKGTADNSGSYTGKRTVPYQVAAESIADKKCSIAISSQSYTGKPVTFDLDNPKDCRAFQAKITLGSGKSVDLIPNQDFEIVSYSRNTACGTAKAVIRGIGSYGGSRTVKFKIEKQRIG